MRLISFVSVLSVSLLLVYIAVVLFVLNEVIEKDYCAFLPSSPGCLSSLSKPQKASHAPEQKSQHLLEATEDKQIEIWNKAAVGWYLWNSIFNSRLQEKPGEPWSVGTRRFSKYTFTFRSGPGVVPNTVPADVEYLVLVLNGRTPEKVRAARVWLDLLPALVLLRAAAVVLHGDEACNNQWILPYLRARGGLVDALFVVYDDPAVDDKDVFQWPLGVATYRGFPQGPFTVDATSPRPWSCNFLGTVYANSSRETLRDVLLSVPDHNCLLKTREQWTESESHQSASDYVEALLQSDLTLSPAGRNAECYRLYEAAALGSVPVLLEPPADGGGGGGGCRSDALRLLRRHGAPFVWLRDWRRLPDLLRREAALPDQQKAARRRRLLDWYETFKRRLRNQFINVIVRKFFPREAAGRDVDGQ